MSDLPIRGDIMPGKKDFLTIPECAEFCAVNRSTLWRWIKAGYLEASVTLGGHHRILKEDLESFLVDNEMYPLAKKHFLKNKILIVDDDPMIQKTLSESLSNNKYQTDVAADGFEAGIKVMQFKPDLLILDLIMPRMDGFEVCKLIKKDPMISHIKILILTGYPTDENIDRMTEINADDFLEKPVKVDTLLRHIKDLLEKEPDYRLKKIAAN